MSILNEIRNIKKQIDQIESERREKTKDLYGALRRFHDCSELRLDTSDDELSLKISQEGDSIEVTNNRTDDKSIGFSISLDEAKRLLAWLNVMLT